jgi:hypothetical protein
MRSSFMTTMQTLLVHMQAHPEQHNAARQRVKDILGQVTSSAVSNGLEFWAAATPEQRMATVGGGAAAAAAVAGGIWWLTTSKAGSGVPGSKEEGIGGNVGDRTAPEGSRASRGETSSSGTAQQQGSSGSLWKDLAAALMLRAPALLSSLSQAQSRAGGDIEREEEGASRRHCLCSTDDAVEVADSAKAHKAGSTNLPGKTVLELQNTVAHLDKAVHSVHLYCPGQLFHLQRQKVAGLQGQFGRLPKSPTSNGSRWKGCRLGDLLDGAQQFVLVEGEADARFEFIALRNTWRVDHLPANILVALESLR